MPQAFATGPALDLTIERVIDIPVSLVWRAWTQPEHLEPWCGPTPWRTTDGRFDLRPAGHFRTVMQSPNRECRPDNGCDLEVVPRRRLQGVAGSAANHPLCRAVSSRASR